MDRIKLNSASAEILSQVMDVLDQMRNAGDYKRCVLLYAKLAAVDGKPDEESGSSLGRILRYGNGQSTFGAGKVVDYRNG